MWPFSQIGNFLHGLFDKAGAFIKKMWVILKPFAQEILSREGKLFWETSQELIIKALQTVASKGLPTTEAKQKEFASIMKTEALDKWDSIKESEQSWMRETGLLILKKIIAESLS